MYKTLLGRWRLTQNTSATNPTNDCLAIARDTYCAAVFPKCENSNRVMTEFNKCNIALQTNM